MNNTPSCPNCGKEAILEDRFCRQCHSALVPERIGQCDETTNPAQHVPLDFTSTKLDPIWKIPNRPPDSEQTEFGFPPNHLLLNRYRIRRELGIGGMGRVYLATDERMESPVAIKVLREVLSRDPLSVKRLVAEAKASMRLAHPNIVRVNTLEDSGLQLFLVMEYVEGETLAQRLAHKGKLSEKESRQIAAAVCRGLEHAHENKVIHRDIKPGNILINKSEVVKIADFGIARICRESMSRLTSQLDSGTLLYMSPEQLDGESSEASDLYSLGVVLYEMLSGEPPFQSGDIPGQIRAMRPKPLQGVSDQLKAMVMRCLEKKPAQRFSSVAKLREELERTATDRGQKPERSVQELIAEGCCAFERGGYHLAIQIWGEVLTLSPSEHGVAELIQSARQRQVKEEADGLKRTKAAVRNRYIAAAACVAIVIMTLWVYLRSRPSDGITTEYGITYKKTNPVDSLPFSPQAGISPQQEAAKFAEFIRTGVFESDSYLVSLNTEGATIRGGIAKYKFDVIPAGMGNVVDGNITASEAKFSVDYSAPGITAWRLKFTLVRNPDGHLQLISKGPLYTLTSKYMKRVGDKIQSAQAPATQAAAPPPQALSAQTLWENDLKEPAFMKIMSDAADEITDSLASGDIKRCMNTMQEYRSISQNSLAKRAQKAQSLYTEAKTYIQLGEMVQKKSGRAAASTYYSKALNVIIELQRELLDTSPINRELVRILSADATFGLGHKDEAVATYRELMGSRDDEVSKAAADRYNSRK